VALAGWDRISDILSLENTMTTAVDAPTEQTTSVMSFDTVSFGYTPDKEILHHISFDLEPGKTYALVGPTGGGKTTTASLMARLYDPVTGVVRLHGRDIRSYSNAERTQKIGFILQEPLLFSGTVGENIVYGNPEFASYDEAVVLSTLREHKLDNLLARFPDGLATAIRPQSDSVSLGQKQLIAFMRAVLRHPDILILDEATANIDTVTEQLLEEILRALPPATTRVIIAHRLNTIENADEIFFVNAGEVVRAGSFAHAVDMLMHGKRES
jgi:ATP-binding cassette subfamily B protein